MFSYLHFWVQTNPSPGGHDRCWKQFVFLHGIRCRIRSASLNRDRPITCADEDLRTSTLLDFRSLCFKLSNFTRLLMIDLCNYKELHRILAPDWSNLIDAHLGFSLAAVCQAWHFFTWVEQVWTSHKNSWENNTYDWWVLPWWALDLGMKNGGYLGPRI